MKQSFSKNFDILLSEATSVKNANLDFKFDKMLQANNSRKRNRRQANGVAYIYDEENELIGKAELADVSESGARVKTSELKCKPGSFVTIIFISAGTQFDRVTCKIRWIADIDVQFKCRQMGLEFATITPAFKEKFSRFMDLK